MRQRSATNESVKDPKSTIAGHTRGWTCWPFFRKPLTKKQVQAQKGTQEARNLSASFSEHTWDITSIMEAYPTSNINRKTPTSSLGLSINKADQILQTNGFNVLPAPKEISDLELYVRQFTNLLWVLLLVASSFSLLQFFLDTTQMINLYTAFLLYGMIVVMCTTSWWQEREARKVVRGFQNLLPEESEVIRGSRIIKIPASHLVVGDIIRIKSGQRVPADCRILHCSQLKLETSSITGEAEPIEYRADPVAETVSVFESRNIAFNGSLCVDGEGTGLVIRTATNTIIGQIADLTTGQGEKKSRFEQEIFRFVKFLAISATTIGIIIWVGGGITHGWHNSLAMFATAFLAASIGMVPCGMPATVTSILTVTARVMASKNVYLKRLDVIEALGSSNIIASDKTGTLTMNEMTVTDVWYSNHYISADTEASMQTTLHTTFYKKIGDNITGVAKDILIQMCVCNSARFSETGNQRTVKSITENEDAHKAAVNLGITTERQVMGSPSEAAMLRYADGLTNVDRIRMERPPVFEIPFNSIRKWQLKIVKGRNVDRHDSEYKLFITGASDVLLKMCSEIRTDDGPVPYDEKQQTHFQNAYDKFGKEGRRVIGFASKTFVAPNDIVFNADSENYPMSEMCFVGVCAIMDPPRPSTATAIAQCQRAGIKVFMVTGDHPATAEGIARQIGMIDDAKHDWSVIHGDKIRDLTEREWDSLISCQFLVFARTTPEQKLMIVEQCQKRKHVITMTGDGVNDAPALKKADVGVAMGSGSDVAKQAADIILMDDNFSSIVKGIEMGRMMFDNIKKLLAYTMVHCFPELVPVALNFSLGFPVGLTSIQILSIDLGTELAPGISMYKEPIEGDIMLRPPRNMKKKLVSNSLLAYGYLIIGQLQWFVAFAAYCVVFWTHNINIGDLWMSSIEAWQVGGKEFVSNNQTFSVDEQLHIQKQACSAWLIGIVFGQFWHLFGTRTRRQSIFTHGLFVNKSANLALVIEIVLLCIYVYVPPVASFLGGTAPPWQVWPVVGFLSILICIYNEIRKYYIRKYPKNKYVRLFKW